MQRDPRLYTSHRRSSILSTMFTRHQTTSHLVSVLIQGAIRSRLSCNAEWNLNPSENVQKPSASVAESSTQISVMPKSNGWFRTKQQSCPTVFSSVFSLHRLSDFVVHDETSILLSLTVRVNHKKTNWPILLRRRRKINLLVSTLAYSAIDQVECRTEKKNQKEIFSKKKKKKRRRCNADNCWFADAFRIFMKIVLFRAWI